MSSPVAGAGSATEIVGLSVFCVRAGGASEAPRAPRSAADEGLEAGKTAACLGATTGRRG